MSGLGPVRQRGNSRLVSPVGADSSIQDEECIAFRIVAAFPCRAALQAWQMKCFVKQCVLRPKPEAIAGRPSPLRELQVLSTRIMEGPPKRPRAHRADPGCMQPRCLTLLVASM